MSSTDFSTQSDPTVRKAIPAKEITRARGFAVLAAILAGFLATVLLLVLGIFLALSGHVALGVLLLILDGIAFIALCILCAGFHVVKPNEALVLTLFGNYYGTIMRAGFYHTNPFCLPFNPAGKTLVTTNTAGGTQTGFVGSNKISTKVLTLNNERQKVNDMLGNPVIIGAVVLWRVKDPTNAVFQVDNYKKYLSIQCDSTIRNIARLYPYDVMDGDEDGEQDEKTLRASSQEIAESMTRELQNRVSGAGLEVLEVRITHLSYAEEIAAAMLQRQQAAAIIAARKKIVEGAVSMVKMAIDELGREEIIVLDDERKAAMVSNLLVVLCGNKDAQPIVNSGSIY